MRFRRPHLFGRRADGQRPAGWPGEPVHPPTLALTLLWAGFGGGVAWLLHLPIPMLLGSLTAVAGAALLGARPLGHPPQLPLGLRQVFIPVIGVSIGGNVGPELLADLGRWWPSFLAFCLFLPLIHYAGYRAVKATRRVSPITAYFGTAPGGLVETGLMGESLGADVRMFTLMQFMRLVLTMVSVPLIFTLLFGHAVGSAGGARMTQPPAGPADLLWLAAAGVAGLALGRLLRIPGAIIIGPLLLSAAVHAAGLASGGPPAWLMVVTQLVIGAAHGALFTGLSRGHLFLAVWLAALSVGAAMLLGLPVAFLVSHLVAEPLSEIFLAFAPAGLAEMSLIALSLELSVVYVAAHHVIRIGLAVFVSRSFSGRVPKEP